MTYLVNQGKVFYWGTSEWTAQQIMEAYSVARQYQLVPPSIEQPEYNMFRREKVEKDFLPLYKSIGLGKSLNQSIRSTGLTIDQEYVDGRLLHMVS